tara:strand:+ start:56 stop:307 length:252 start_codon:yes stop_codon:yes gene_type:complete
MQINLTTPKEIITAAKTLIISPEKITTINSIKVTNLLDDPINKKVLASTKEVGNLILWEGAAYDAIGQWTDTDVQNRILEMYS